MATNSSSTMPETGTVISSSVSRKKGSVWASLRLFPRKGIDTNENKQNPEQEDGKQGAKAVGDEQKLLVHAPRDGTHHEYEFDEVSEEGSDAENKDGSSNWHEILPSSSTLKTENTNEQIDNMRIDDLLERHAEQESDHLRGVVGTTIVCSQLLDDTGVSSELESSDTASALSLHPSMVGSSVIEPTSNEGDDGASGGKDHSTKARTHEPSTADVKDELGCLAVNAAVAGEQDNSDHLKEMPLAPDSTEKGKKHVDHESTEGTSETGDQDHTPDSFLKVGMRLLKSPRSSQRDLKLSSDGDCSRSNSCRGDASRKNLSKGAQCEKTSQSPGVAGCAVVPKIVMGFLLGGLFIMMYTKYLSNPPSILVRRLSERSQTTATETSTETDQKDRKYFKTMDDSETMGAEQNDENGNGTSDTLLQLRGNFSMYENSPSDKVLLIIEGNPAYLLTTLQELSFPFKETEFLGTDSYSITSSINNEEGSQMKQLTIPLPPEAHADAAQNGESALEAGRNTSTPWFPDVFCFFRGIEYSALALLFIWCLCSFREKRTSKVHREGGRTAAARRVGNHPGKVSVGVLKAELRKRNHPVSASKSDLIGRLQESNLHRLNSVSWEALKVELRAKGIKVQGRRLDLVDRLQKAERDALECLKVEEIQDKLREKGLPVSILKSDLIGRLRAAIRVDLDAQEVSTLRDRLRRRGLSSSGVRAHLIERLERAEYDLICSC